MPFVLGFGAVFEVPGSVFVEEGLCDDGRPADAEGGSTLTLMGGEVTGITRIFISREDKGGVLESNDKVFNVLGSPVVAAFGESVDKVGKEASRLLRLTKGLIGSHFGRWWQPWTEL